MRLAEQEGVPLWKVKRMTPYREFLLWKAKWELDDEEEFTRKDKIDFYLAQIAREIRVVLYKAADAKKVNVNDFLLKFVWPGKKKKAVPKEQVVKPEELKPEDEAEIIKKNTEKSQSFWLRFVGLSKKKVLNNGT